jgi:hypothetical protein
MPARALWTGIFLIVISTLAVVASKPSPTAFIPGGLGLLIAVLGIVAERSPGMRKNAIHAALGLALLGAIGSLRGIPGFITLLGGGTVALPVAVMAQIATLFICLAFLTRGVRSFMDARRKVQ